MTLKCAPRAAALPTLIAALCVCAGVRAEPPWTPSEVRRAQARERAEELEQLSSHLSGVETVEAQVTPADPLGVPLDSPPPTRVVRLRVTAARKHWGNLRDELPRLAAVVFPGPAEAELSLELAAPSVAPEPTWSSVGPFRVARATAGPLRATLGLLLACSFGLALLLVRYSRARLRASTGANPGRQ